MHTGRDGAIIILEGADCAGKTTLAHAISRHVMDQGGDFLYLHGSPWPGTVEKQHQRMQDDAFYAVDHGYVVVLDHFWVAEQIYGAIYRGGPAYDPASRDMVFKMLGAIICLCAPDDLKKQIARHAERHAKGKEHFSDARDVIARYADLWKGNLTHQGESYVDRYIRHGDFYDRPDVVRYDMDRNMKDYGISFADGLLKQAQRYRKAIVS